jgi:F-type H+-transporting ATPase subunit gamma
MATLKSLKNRIGSVKSTRKITKAMQMVAAAKLRRAQEQAESARPYAERMSRMLATLSQSMQGRHDAPELLVGNGRDLNHLIVVLTAHRGLCGGFNGSIVRGVKKRTKELQSQHRRVKLLCIGKKGREMLIRDYADSLIDTPKELAGIGRNKVSFAEAQSIAKHIVALYDDLQFDVCTLVFNRFKSVIAQEVTFQQILPLAMPEVAEAETLIYDYEPDEETVLMDLLPRNMAVQIYRALLENAASEQGARMSAMDNATRNAGEMIGKLTLQYNRSRQAAITKELIEIISGAEAV